eukprot:RCo049711
MYLLILCALIGLCALVIFWTGLPLKFRSLFRGSSVSRLHPAATRALSCNLLLAGEQPPPPSKRCGHRLAAALVSQLVGIGLDLVWQVCGQGPAQLTEFAHVAAVGISAALAAVHTVALLWWVAHPQGFPFGSLRCAALLLVWPVGMAVALPRRGEAIVGVLGWGLLGTLIGLQQPQAWEALEM